MIRMSDPTLFTSLQLGKLQLKHRVVMAPLTRSRSIQPHSIPGDLMLEYYRQRASDGGLIISEATNISVASRGWLGAPGLYSDEQVRGWTRIVDTVHDKGGVMVAQLWHTGRASHVQLTDGPAPVSASVDPSYWQEPAYRTSTVDGWISPSPHRALETEEIGDIVRDYRQAAERAMQAGFDGVELHGANGYLIDQFLQNGSNKRTDKYGGSIENRVRLALEVVEALVSVWGGSRVGVRIGPGGSFNAMSDSNPDALFDHLADQLNAFDLAYLHVIEPRVRGNVVIQENQSPTASARLREIFKGGLIAAGGFEPETAESAVTQGLVDAVAFGRYFVSNPDLPRRIERHLPLADYDRDTFYTFDSKGYIDYPAASAEQATAGEPA
jgi:N-ethylmaleimide reductase